MDARITKMATFLFAALAHATPREVQWSYERLPGTEDCPNQAAVEREVVDRLKMNPFVAESPLELSVRFEKSGRNFLAALEVFDQRTAYRGARELLSQAGDCRELASAVSLAIAIAVDPQYGAPAVLPTKPAASASPEPSPPGSPRPLGPRQVDVTLGGLLGIGLSHRPAWGPMVGARLRWQQFSVGIESRGEFPGAFVFEGRKLTGYAALGSVVPCGHWGAYALCGVASAGALWLKGELGTPTRLSASPLTLVGLRGAVDLPGHKRVSFRVFLDVQASLLRTSALVGNSRAWTAPGVAGTLGFALDLHFLR